MLAVHDLFAPLPVQLQPETGLFDDVDVDGQAQLDDPLQKTSLLPVDSLVQQPL